MISRFGNTFLFFILFASAASAAPNIVQSLVVNFPANGRVIVQAREEIGKFPQMMFISQKTGRVIFKSSIEDQDKWLVPDKNFALAQPQLRFRVARSSGFQSPLIMSVGLAYGGSDNHFYLTVFGEFKGKIERLNDKPMFANIQGGYYLGHLSKKLGSGLAVWNFVWGHGVDEIHYSRHHYEMAIYQLQHGKFKQVFRGISRRMYDSNKGANSLREIGITVTDQRAGIPKIKTALQ